MQFKAVVGQNKAKEGIINMTRSARLPHALLICGREGTGGLPLALAMAQYVLCSNRTETDSCGHCPNCHKVQKLEHADVHLAFPAIKFKQEEVLSRNFIKEFREFVRQTPYGTTYEWLQYIDAENKQGNIYATQCREIIDALSLKSYEGGYKIQIMWRPEYLEKEGNILLKLIEEPPPNTLLLLIAEDKEEILATILSRTQLIQLAPISASQIASALQERGVEQDPVKAAQIGSIAGGSYTEALHLAQHLENDLLTPLKDWFNALFRNLGPQLVKFSDEWHKAGREQQKNFLMYVLAMLTNALRVQYNPQMDLQVAPGEEDFVRRLIAMKLSPEVLRKMSKHISDTIYFIERNASSKVQLHALSIRLMAAIKGKELV